MGFGAFLGVAGRNSSRFFSLSSGWTRVWNFSQPELALWARNSDKGCVLYGHSGGNGETEPAVFVWGKPLVASDCEFDEKTRIERIPLQRLPQRIASLYERYGTRAFAFLEGNFCLVVVDRKLQSILLVVDKFGCDDLYICRRDLCLAFASHPSFVTERDPRFDARATAFFLAQEGFVPAPFTLFEGIETVGRAKYLRIKVSAGKVSIHSERYWFPSQCSVEMSRADAVQQFHAVLAKALESRLQTRNGILLSGGIDSALLANLIVSGRKCDVVAMTGSIRGSSESETEVHRAAAVAQDLGIPHHVVNVNPRDESLPSEWTRCIGSWSGGTRTTLPLFSRFASRMRDIYGTGYSTFSGQMADTLADNNFTLPSIGYTMRRLFFSPWFLKILPFARTIVPHKAGWARRVLSDITRLFASPRLFEMAESALDGLSHQTRFYEGRSFGFGEMPGRSHKVAPGLSQEGFERIADWYSSNFVAPVVSRLSSETFYTDMLELSLDMVMLHLDTRLVLHAFRLSGGSAELPFLDSRVVKFLTSLPYSARAFYRRPKYVIDAQFGRHAYARGGRKTESKTGARCPAEKLRKLASFEELLLAGSLGSFFRELLARGTALSLAPGLDEFVDEAYIERQLRAFQRGLDGVDCKFISRLAAFEFWSQTNCNEGPLVSSETAIA